MSTTDPRPMTSTEEKAALAWLDRAYSIEDDRTFGCPFSAPHRAIIKAMLAERDALKNDIARYIQIAADLATDPRLPEEPSEEIERVMWQASESVQTKDGWDPGRARVRAAYHALYAYLKGREKQSE